MAGSPIKRARRAARERAEEKVKLIRNLPAIIPKPEEPADRWGRRGRPTSYRPEYAEQARILFEEGATALEVAAHFGVCRKTVYEWRINYPEFGAIFSIGREQADDRAERTLFEQAIGYTSTVTETVKLKDNKGNEYAQVVTREVEVPPNPMLLMFWLKNRRGDRWRDKTETAVSGEVVHLTYEQVLERALARIAEIRQKQIAG